MKIKIYSHIKDIAPIWDSINSHSVMLESPYLRALESSPPSSVEFKYAIFYRNNQPIGKAYFQVLHFNGEKSLAPEPQEEATCLIGVIKRGLKKLIAQQIQLRTIIVGNLLSSGTTPYYFEHTPSKEHPQLINDAICDIIEEYQKAKKDIPIITLKDVDPTNDFFEISTSSLPEYHPFTIQPVMMMDIPEEWIHFDDYMASLSSKYRVRTKRALKMSATYSKKELDVALMTKYKDQMTSLFKDVVKNAKFNMVDINMDYFFSLKTYLPDDFKIFGYFEEDEMVGFYTTIQDKYEIKAHFLGYNVQKNKSQKIYMNMLYDIINDGIISGSKRINFTRTATEIKSSIGAYSVDYPCYLRHRKNYTNHLVPHLLNYFNPTEEWIPRNPFKEKKNTTKKVS